MTETCVVPHNIFDRWDWAARILATQGSEGLARAARQIGRKRNTLRRWARYGRLMPPAVRERYPRLTEGLLERAIQAGRLFPANQPESRFTYWLDFAHQHNLNRDEIVLAARRQRRGKPSISMKPRVSPWASANQPPRDVLLPTATSPVEGSDAVSADAFVAPSSGLPDIAALASVLASWQTIPATVSVTERGRLATQFAQQLAEAVAMFNRVWGPYYLGTLQLSHTPQPLDDDLVAI